MLVYPGVGVSRFCCIPAMVCIDGLSWYWHMTQFEIECMCGGHSVTKKFMTILQMLVAKPKLWKNLYFYKEYIFNLKINFVWLKSGKMLLAVPKNGLF